MMSMILDFHTHIFSEDVCADRVPFLSDGQFRLIYENEKAKIIGGRDLLAAMERSGIDYSVAMGFPWERDDFCADQNEYLHKTIKNSAGKIIPFGSVPLRESADADSWVRDIKAKGLRGIGEVAFYQQGMGPDAVRRLDILLSAVEQYSLPLCLHVNEPVGHQYPGKYDPGLGLLADTIARHPDAIVILSHWGGGLLFYELMPEIAKALANCYYDTAATPFLYAELIYGIAPLIAGPERILFGSDYPLLPARRYFEPVRRAIENEEWKAAILGKNAARLLNIF